MWILKVKGEDTYFSRIDKDLAFMLGNGVVTTDSLKYAKRFETKQDAIYQGKYANRWTKWAYKWEAVKI